MFEKPSNFPDADAKKSFKDKKCEAPNVTEIETSNAQYRMYYDNHESDIDPHLLDGCDGLIMEMLTDYSDLEKAQKMFEKICYSKGLRGLFQEAAKTKKSIFFVDMDGNTNDLAIDINRKEVKSVVEFLAGAGIGVHALKSLTDNEKMNRRSFLKLGLKTAASAYLATPLLQDTFFKLATDKKTDLTNENSASRKTEKVLNKFNAVVHPEMRTKVVEIRNDVMAQKSETIARNFKNKTGKKPKLAFVVGARHSGIEQSLADNEQERIGRLKKDLREKLSQNAAIAEVVFTRENEKEINYDIKIIKDAAMEKC